MLQQNNRPDTPLFSTINVTGICNFDCPYCFCQPRSHEHMLYENYQKVVDILKKAKIFFLMLSGGEPFTHPAICEMLDYAHKEFKHVITITNGSLLNDEHFSTIETILKKKGGFPIQVSIDDINVNINSNTRKSTNIVLSNLYKLKEIGANITIASVMNKFNKDSIIDSLELLSDITHSFHIMPVKKVKALNGSDDYLALQQHELSELWEKIAILKEEYNLEIEVPCYDCSDNANSNGIAFGAPCMAGFSTIVIDPNLDVRPCDRLTECVVGNLHNQSLMDVWDGETLKKIWGCHLPYCLTNGMELE